MALLTTQNITRAGITPTFAACTAGGDTAVCGANTYIEVKNVGGTQCVVTLATNAAAAPWSSTALAAETVTVPITTGDKIFGPINPQLFGNASDGLCYITYSQVTSCTIGVFNLGQP